MYWLKRLAWDTYIIIFYITVLLVFVIFLDILYLALAAKMKKHTYTQPVSLLRGALTLLVPILIVPISGNTCITPKIIP